MKRKVYSFPGGAPRQALRKLFSLGPAGPYLSWVEGEADAAALLSPLAWAETRARRLAQEDREAGSGDPKAVGHSELLGQSQVWETSFWS